VVKNFETLFLSEFSSLKYEVIYTIWSDRQDWVFGVDMCYYYEANIQEPKKSKAIVPDGFLAIGVLAVICKIMGLAKIR
jgi:hypothetical protein